MSTRHRLVLSSILVGKPGVSQGQQATCKTRREHFLMLYRVTRTVLNAVNVARAVLDVVLFLEHINHNGLWDI